MIKILYDNWTAGTNIFKADSYQKYDMSRNKQVIYNKTDIIFILLI